MKNNKNLPTCIKDIPVDVKVAKDLKNLSKDIEEEKDELKRTLEEIDSKTCPIEIERNLFGIIKKSSVEDACHTIYSDLSGYIKDCGEAIQKTNENLGRSLELIKLLAIVEKDLYEQIDDQIVRSNEINENFIDWCKQQGINDDGVRGLLETSFHRAHTLRDRIKNLREEFRNSITELSERVKGLETKALSFDNIIEEKKRDFETFYENKYNTFVNLVDEKNRLVEESHNRFCEKLEEAKKTIADIKDKIRLFNEKEQEIKKELRLFAEAKQKELDKIKTDTKNDLNDFVNQKEKNLTNICCENENEIKRIIKEYENKLEKEHIVLKKSFNKRILYVLFGSVALSSLISYLFTMLLR